MQHIRCLVHINGSPMHVVPKTCTVPEVALLRHIHGADAIRDITVIGDYKPVDVNGDVAEFDEDQERERLVSVYEAAATQSDRGIVDRLFPALGKLPLRLSQIGIDPKVEAATKRATAQRLLEEADVLEDKRKPPQTPRGPRMPAEAGADAA